MSELLTISDGHLIGLSNIAEFKSGLECFKARGVRECSIDDGHISGIVADNTLHAVKLRHTAKHLEGQCDCLTSSDVDFCKHCIALSLHYRHELATHNTLADGDVLDRIRAYINSLSKADLQTALREIIEDDKSLHSQWSTRADLALNKIDSRLIRKRITAAFPYNKRLHRRHLVKEYFFQATGETNLLKKQLPKLDARKALPLIDYALQRLQRALESVDDSPGYRADVLDTLQSLHVDTLARSEWKTERIVHYLIELEDSPAHDFYPQIPNAYEAILGREGWDCFISKKQDEWEKLPPLSFGTNWAQLYPYLKIQVHLLKAARRRNDFYAEINLLEKTCVDLKACLSLCQRLVELKLWDKLEFWLATANRWEQSNSVSKHLPNLDLKRLSSELFINKGRTQDALNLEWEIYQQSENMEDYKRLISTAKLNDSVESVKARVFRLLHKGIEDSETNHFKQRTLSHLVELYLLEQQPEAALDLVNYHALSFKSLGRLIKVFFAQAEIVYPLYRQQLGLLLEQANNHAYNDALALIEECRDSTKTQDRHYFDALLESIKKDFSTNTVFQQLLENALKSDV